MYERSPAALSPTPADYLAALNAFLIETALTTQEQQYWLTLSEGFMGAEQTEGCERAIREEVAANVEIAGTFIQELGGLGLGVFVRFGDSHPLQMRGLAFETDSCRYAAGIVLPEGPTLLPLDGSVQLEIQPAYR